MLGRGCQAQWLFRFEHPRVSPDLSMFYAPKFGFCSKPLYKSSFWISIHVSKNHVFCGLRLGVDPPSNRRLIYGKYGRAWNKSWDLCHKKSGKLAVSGRFSNMTHEPWETPLPPQHCESLRIRFWKTLTSQPSHKKPLASVSISEKPRKMVWLGEFGVQMFIGPFDTCLPKVNRILKGGWCFP